MKTNMDIKIPIGDIKPDDSIINQPLVMDEKPVGTIRNCDDAFIYGSIWCSYNQELYFNPNGTVTISAINLRV